MLQEEGNGWRIAKDISRESFPVLIGGEGWAIELTHQEWTSLVHFVNDLITEYKALSTQAMPEESLCLELERQPWWGRLNGEGSRWTLQLILNGEDCNGRGAEAFWPIPAAQEFTLGMRKVWDSPY